MSNYNDPWVYRHPVISSVLGVVALFAAVIVLSVVAGIIDIGGSNAQNYKEAVSGPNVKEQNQRIIDLWESMDAAVANACQAERIQKERGDPTLVEDPALAYDAVYRNARSDYNAIMDDRFRGGLARKTVIIRDLNDLKEYPVDASTLEERKLELCPSPEQLRQQELATP